MPSMKRVPLYGSYQRPILKEAIASLPTGDQQRCHLQKVVAHIPEDLLPALEGVLQATRPRTRSGDHRNAIDVLLRRMSG